MTWQIHATLPYLTFIVFHTTCSDFVCPSSFLPSSLHKRHTVLQKGVGNDSYGSYELSFNIICVLSSAAMVLVWALAVFAVMKGRLSVEQKLFTGLVVSLFLFNSIGFGYLSLLVKCSSHLFFIPEIGWTNILKKRDIYINTFADSVGCFCRFCWRLLFLL